MTIDITYAGACWLKYNLHCDIICTELPVGNCAIADIAGINVGKDGKPETLIEIEVKKSMSDLKADFENKIKKHANYKLGVRCPNRLYFLMPKDLAEKGKEYLNSQNSKYGILAFDSKKAEEHSDPWRLKESVSSIHKCRQLTKEKPHAHYLVSAFRRLQNEYFAQKYIIQSSCRRMQDDLDFHFKELDNHIAKIAESAERSYVKNDSKDDSLEEENS